MNDEQFAALSAWIKREARDHGTTRIWPPICDEEVKAREAFGLGPDPCMSEDARKEHIGAMYGEVSSFFTGLMEPRHRAFFAGKQPKIVRAWLPIVSAPKDGTVIWLGAPGSMRLGYWSELDGGRWNDLITAETVSPCGLKFEPTHWQETPVAIKEERHP